MNTSISYNKSNYLKTYPYLFVRETDQTDYYCTLCDAYLKEDDLQAHLFEGHQAENVEELFVKVCTETNKPKTSLNSIYICVVCWAKLPHFSATLAHRQSCKVDEDPQAHNHHETQTDSLEIANRKKQEINKNQVSFFPQPPMHPSVVPPSASHGLRCSLCSESIPPAGLLLHLRDFHRVSSSLEDEFNCPFCLSQIAVLDLAYHLASVHSMVPQTAINAILLWVLSSEKSTKPKPPTIPNGNLLPKSTNLSIFSDVIPSKLNSLLTFTNKHKPNNFFSNGGLSNVPNGIPTVLQTLLSRGNEVTPTPPSIPNLAAVENIVSKFTTCHVAANGKQSIQCLICAKWFAVPPVKHLRGHMVTFKDEKRRLISLVNGQGHVCIICYDVFNNLQTANAHLFQKHDIVSEFNLDSGDIPTVIDLHSSSPMARSPQQQPIKANTVQEPSKKVELDNAGRVKSGKVRKQCELCGEWSNIKWFFKHMSEVHKALFCRCCREYLPIHEHEEHKRFHSEPPYMGQKIRIEQGLPVVIDRKERASLTPIGSLAAWGGSSGGKVVKAVDVPSVPKAKKRKKETENNNNGFLGQSFIGHMMEMGEGSPPKSSMKETLMPKETCPVCGIPITYKNLARHIKLRHKIKYKFCHKCRKLVPNTSYEEHRNTCNEIILDGEPIVMEEDEDDDDDIIGEEIGEVVDNDNNSIDPTDFLETSTNVEDDRDQDEDDDVLMINVDTPSKNKLESLMGKEFKHPRRKCNICGYTVSYSNFKRHLRNAHPQQYDECENDLTSMGNLSQEVLEDDEEDEKKEEEMEEDKDDKEDKEDKEDKDSTEMIECSICQDKILKEFMPRHMVMNHNQKEDSEDEAEDEIEDEDANSSDDSKHTCPVCQEKLKSVALVVRHCKMKHKSAYKWCSRCASYIVKKAYKTHLKDECNGLEEKKVFNCPECAHMFLAKDKYVSHLKEVHGKEEEEVEKEGKQEEVEKAGKQEVPSQNGDQEKITSEEEGNKE